MVTSGQRGFGRDGGLELELLGLNRIPIVQRAGERVLTNSLNVNTTETFLPILNVNKLYEVINNHLELDIESIEREFWGTIFPKTKEFLNELGSCYVQGDGADRFIHIYRVDDVIKTHTKIKTLKKFWLYLNVLIPLHKNDEYRADFLPKFEELRNRHKTIYGLIKRPAEKILTKVIMDTDPQFWEECGKYIVQSIVEENFSLTLWVLFNYKTLRSDSSQAGCIKKFVEEYLVPFIFNNSWEEYGRAGEFISQTYKLLLETIGGVIKIICGVHGITI